MATCLLMKSFVQPRLLYARVPSECRRKTIMKKNNYVWPRQASRIRKHGIRVLWRQEMKTSLKNPDATVNRQTTILASFVRTYVYKLDLNRLLDLPWKISSILNVACTIFRRDISRSLIVARNTPEIPWEVDRISGDWIIQRFVFGDF